LSKSDSCHQHPDQIILSLIVAPFGNIIIMKKIRSLKLAVLGDLEYPDSEKYFMIVTCFTTSVFLVFLSVFYLLENLRMLPAVLSGASSLIAFGLYLLVRYYNYLFFSKLTLTLLGLTVIDITWYIKYLSNGPLLFFILIMGALILWLWDGRSLVVLMGIYLLNIIILFIIDYNAPDYLFVYPDRKIRSIDIFLSLILYSSIMIFLLYVIKKDFIRQKERAIRSDKLKSAFLSNMSHEIRTPMNAIVGFSELLENENNYVKRQQYINIIKNSGQNLLNLISDIIDLSKIEAGDLELHFKKFSIRELFTEIKDIFTLELIRKEKSDIIFDFHLPDGDTVIYSDPERIRQVFYNLLTNSIKFTTEGSIIFSCTKNCGELQFSVSDTGTGIPEDDQKKIFDRFSKFNYKGLNNEGSGIGLSVVEKIVTLLKGKVWLKSEYGKGTTVFFSLPYYSDF
jgi:signal transduction histidine kinase